MKDVLGPLGKFGYMRVLSFGPMHYVWGSRFHFSNPLYVSSSILGIEYWNFHRACKAIESSG